MVSRSTFEVPDLSLLWADVNEQRGNHVLHMTSVVRMALDRGHAIDWRSLGAISRLAASGEDQHDDPALVAEFLVSLTGDMGDLHALDPWAGFGVSLSALLATERIRSAKAIEINQEVADLGERLMSDARVKWIRADASVELAGDAAQYDLVVGSPPINLPRARLRMPDGTDLATSASYTMLVQAALVLAPGGLMAIVLPESFFQSPGEAARRALENMSVYPVGSFALPVRSFRTHSIPTTVVVFGREPRELLFTAELEPGVDYSQVVANFRGGRQGKMPSLGLLVQRSEFRSWRALMRHRDIVESGRRSGLQVVPLREVVREVMYAKADGDPFEAIDNAVYLPTLGTGPVLTQPGDLGKPSNYLQLLLDPERCDAEYLAAFLSSSAGGVIREQFARGDTIRKVSRSSLEDAVVLLPPTIDQQRAAVGTAKDLKDLLLGVSALERTLWDRPLQARRVRQAFAVLRTGDGFEQWMESLPFPLATVLWRYRAADDPEKRCRLLVHFFEAATVFLVDVLFSGLQAEHEILMNARRQGPDGGPGYHHGSIGIWADLLARLAGRTRELVANEPKSSSEIFRVTDLTRLQEVASKSVVALLKDDAATYRREWIGHPAVVSANQWARRLEEAEATLAQLRDALGTSLIGWRLTRPGHGRMRQGVYETGIEDLTGTRREFRRATIGLREVPEADELYLLEEGASLMLKLAPLVRLRRAPDSVEDAAYFYDRVDQDGVRWVSYHFEQEAEFHTHDDEVLAVIDTLGRLG